MWEVKGSLGLRLTINQGILIGRYCVETEMLLVHICPPASPECVRELLLAIENEVHLEMWGGIQEPQVLQSHPASPKI